MLGASPHRHVPSRRGIGAYPPEHMGFVTHAAAALPSATSRLPPSSTYGHCHERARCASEEVPHPTPRIRVVHGTLYQGSWSAWNAVGPRPQRSSKPPAKCQTTPADGADARSATFPDRMGRSPRLARMPCWVQTMRTPCNRHGRHCYSYRPLTHRNRRHVAHAQLVPKWSASDAGATTKKRNCTAGRGYLLGGSMA